MRPRFMIVLWLCVLASDAFAIGSASRIDSERIRPQDARTANLLAAGAVWSATFGGLARAALTGEHDS